jgi:hypothetical protein
MQLSKRKKDLIKIYSIPILGVGIIGALGMHPNIIAFRNEVANNQIIETKNAANTVNAVKIEKKVFGHSKENRPIEGYEIGEGSTVLFLFGAIHGHEIGTADLLNTFMEEIGKTPGALSPDKKLIIIPVSNPDGYEKRAWKVNANNVNLNLNFATSDWQEWGREGTYAGPAPFSEEESKVIKSVVEQYKPSMMISYHSYGHLVAPEADDASIALAKWYSEKTGYEYYDETMLDWDYPGTATKWFVESTGNPALTVELTDHSQSDWEINKPALFELIK